MSDLAITDAVILPMTEVRKSFRGDLRIQDGVIVEIGEEARPRPLVLEVIH